MDLITEKFSVRAAVDSVCAGARSIALKQSIDVDAVVSPELDLVMLDKQKFKQILYNLLSNAIKFTGERGLVRIRVESQDAHHLKLEVKDTGIGIKRGDTWPGYSRILNSSNPVVHAVTMVPGSV